MTPLATLPPELIDHILGFLSRDIATLRSCSKALEPFEMCALVDRWLYKNISVYTGSRDSGGRHGRTLRMNASQLAMLLRGSSNVISTTSTNLVLSTYIQSLRITLGSPSLITWFMSRSLGDAEITPLLASPSLMPSLRALTLSSNGDCIPWIRCNEGFRKAFVQRLAWSNNYEMDNRRVIDEVKLKRIEYFPLRLLENCGGLRKLHLEGSFEWAPQAEGASLRVQHLAIYHCSPSLHIITTWLTHPTIFSPNPECIISNLRSLDFRTSRADNFAFLPRLLGPCKETLQDLTIDYGGESFTTTYTVPPSPSSNTPVPALSTLASSLPLRSLVALRKLTIYTSIVSQCQYVALSQGDESLIARTYRSSIEEIAASLVGLWEEADGEQEVLTNLKEIELKISLHLSGWDAPMLSEMDFEPLRCVLSGCTNVASTSSTSSSVKMSSKPTPSPLLTLNIVSTKRSSQPSIQIPFSKLQEDIKKNGVLNRLVKDGKVMIIGR
ncbi:hypothetical protein CPB83DRAFT_511465 [Crepidotus variabilis]|uniref:F-box domain-containing protein n=1 Tax=Crepidotus variabilis TaxID=179855 RepID=A0A9P6EAN9_9AGAR|nr:hypothetical protein CPB83DRAFT_511465 [Crepidotus variabilis]